MKILEQILPSPRRLDRLLPAHPLLRDEGRKLLDRAAGGLGAERAPVVQAMAAAIGGVAAKATAD